MALFRHEFFRILRGSAFFFLVRVIGAVVTYATQILLAHWIGPVGLGNYVLAFSWCIVLTNVSVMGFPNAAVRFIGTGLAQNDRDEIRGFVRKSQQIVTVSSLVVAGLAAGVVLLGSSWLSPDQIGPLLIAFASVPLFSLIRIYGGIAQGFSWFPQYVLPSQLLRPALLLLAIWVVWEFGYPLSADSVLALHFGAMLLLVVGQGLLISWRLRNRLAGTNPKYRTSLWVRTSVPLFFIAMFTVYFPELNIVVAGIFLPDADLAVYNAGFRTAFFIGLGIAAVDGLTLPGLTRLHHLGDRGALQTMVSRATLIKFAGALIAVVILVAFGKEVLAIFGREFIRGYGPLLLIGLGQLARAALGPGAELLGVTGQQDQCLIVFVISLLAAIALNGILVPLYGLMGAAASVFLVTVASAFWLHALVIRHLGVHPSILACRR